MPAIAFIQREVEEQLGPMVLAASVKARGFETLYPLAFYWFFGHGLRKRYGLSWPFLLRYWLYSKEGARWS